MSEDGAMVFELNAHARMSVEDVLTRAARNHASWDQVILLGFDDDGDFQLQSCHLTREGALWLIETAKAYISAS